MDVLLKTRIGRAFLALLLWSAIGCIFAVPNIVNGPNWRMSLLGSLCQWWAWGLVTPLILALDRRMPFSARQLPRRFFAHLIPSLLFTAGYMYVNAAVLAVFKLVPWGMLLNTRILENAFKGMYLWSWLVYWLILGAWQVYQYYEHYLSNELRMERLERRFSEARLNALRMQLDPHFLFNALNAISSQVERDPRLARGMIGHLGDLLRLSLETKDRHEVPLSDELAFLDHYLAIQKIRFGDNLKIDIRIAPEVRFALVPCLIVQPLVENAIRHGISQRVTGGTVTVTAAAVGDRLDLRVIDDGVGLPAGWRLETSKGLGLSVTRERISSLHPNGDSRFTVARRRDNQTGTEVDISLPLRFPGKEQALAS